MGTPLAKSQDTRQVRTEPAHVGSEPDDVRHKGEFERTGGAMGMATARQGLPSVNSGGGWSIDGPGEDSPERGSRKRGK